MIFIFGTRSVGRTLQTGQFICPFCRVPRDYTLKKYRRFFTLFFIPVIPLDSLGEHLVCQGCKNHYVPTGFEQGAKQGAPESNGATPVQQ